MGDVTPMDKRIRELWACLTPEQRDVMLLRGEGLSYAEIGEKLGIIRESARRRFLRGKAAMQKQALANGWRF